MLNRLKRHLFRSGKMSLLTFSVPHDRIFPCKMSYYYCCCRYKSRPNAKKLGETSDSFQKKKNNKYIVVAVRYNRFPGRQTNKRHSTARPLVVSF